MQCEVKGSLEYMILRNDHIKLDEKIMSTQTHYFVTYMEQQYTDVVA